MVSVRPPFPTIAVVAAIAAMQLAVSTYGSDLPPLLTAGALGPTTGHISLTSSTLQRRQPFPETPEPLFTPTQFDDPWRTALPDQNSSTSRAGTDLGDRQRATSAGEPGAIHPTSAVPLAPGTQQLRNAGSIEGASGTDKSASAGNPWGSELEPAQFDEGLPIDILGIIQWTLITLLLSAAFIVVILRRFAPNGPKRPAGSRRIQVLETTRIAAGSSLQLVQIDSHRFLVALDGSGVKSVTGLPEWFESPEEADETPTSAEANLQLLRSQPLAADPEPGKAA